MDTSLFPSLFSFQRKMKPVLKSIKNIYSKNSYVNIEIHCASSFKKIDGVVVYIPLKEKSVVKINMCKFCNNNKFITVLPSNYFEHETYLQSLDFYNCRYAVENLHERFDYEQCSPNNYDDDYYNKQIIYKCCSICGFYLHGGTSALQCSNQSHFEIHNVKRIEEDKKYLKHLLEIEFTCVKSKKYFKNYWGFSLQNGIVDNLRIINVIEFHLETEYFFVDHQELFELVFDFIDMNSIFISFNDDDGYEEDYIIYYHDFYYISKKLFEFHTPLQLIKIY
jgi:hypothetical protein